MDVRAEIDRSEGGHPDKAQANTSPDVCAAGTVFKRWNDCVVRGLRKRLWEQVALRNSLGRLSRVAPLQPTGSVAFVLIVVQLDAVGFGKCAGTRFCS